MNIQDFHIKHDYFIKAEQIDKKTLVVKFPETNIDNTTLPSLTKCYLITYDGIEIVTSKNTKNIVCPEYVKRVLVSQDISITAYKYNICEKLIIAYNKDGVRIEGKGRVTNLLDRPKSNKQFKLEQDLYSVFIKFLNGEKYEVSSNIQNGFNILIESVKK